MLLSVAALSLVSAAVCRPVWRALDPEIHVRAVAEGPVAGVYLDPWGGVLIDPAKGPLVVPVTRGTETSRGLTRAAGYTHHYFCDRSVNAYGLYRSIGNELRARREQATDDLDRQRLERALEYAKVNGRGAYRISWGPTSPPPYRHVQAWPPQLPRPGWFELLPYSTGPNHRDELGHGDDVRYLDAQGAKWQLYQRWIWLVPLLVGLTLLMVLVLCRLIPPAPALRGELARCAVITAVVGVALAASGLRIQLPVELVALLEVPWQVGWLSLDRALVWVYLLGGSFFGALFLRLPRLPQRAPGSS